MSKKINVILWFFGSYIWLGSACIASHTNFTTMIYINAFVSGWYFMTGILMLYGKED